MTKNLKLKLKNKNLYQSKILLKNCIRNFNTIESGINIQKQFYDKKKKNSFYYRELDV